jgi:hypothetical protein
VTKRFKRIYLHIGLGKTGSSSIQRFLLDHAAELENTHNIHYPDLGGVDHRFAGNHSRYLRVLFGSEEETRKVDLLSGRNTREQAQQYRQEVQDNLDSGFEASSAEMLLLSAEGAAHLYRPALASLSRWLQQLGEEITLIACIRHPLGALSSEIQQRLKTGATLEDLYQSPPHYRFKPMLVKMKEVFPRADIRVYDFARATRHPQGLEAAFADQLGIEINVQRSSSARAANTAMSMEAALVLSSLNRLHPMVKDNQRNPLRSSGLLHEVTAIPGAKYSAPAAVFSTLAQEVGPQLEWLKATYQLELETPKPGAPADPARFSPRKMDRWARRLVFRHRLRQAFPRLFRTQRRGRKPNQ